MFIYYAEAAYKYAVVKIPGTKIWRNVKAIQQCQQNIRMAISA